ncbi:MAG TPA: hypothetical protein VN698_15630 [Bacteroidia bacterium]|nr:hypothetical protein [Bacteroidia bacterium]
MFDFGLHLKKRLCESEYLEALNIRRIDWILEGTPSDELKSTGNGIFFYLKNEQREAPNKIVQNWVIYFNVEHGNSQGQAELIMQEAGAIAKAIKDTLIGVKNKINGVITYVPKAHMGEFGSFEYLSTTPIQYQESTFLQVRMDFELSKGC